jgi:hypothetical protein
MMAQRNNDTGGAAARRSPMKLTAAKATTKTSSASA